MKKPPNIIVVQSDDHARWALPFYGGAEFAAPNISALAEKGIVVDNAYTPTPVCSPARASFLTGLMPSQHGIRDFISSKPEFHEKDWLQGIDTLPQQLARSGYTCGLVGKWHLGRARKPAPGFDFWYAMSGAYPIAHMGSHEMSIGGEIVKRDGVLTDVITEGAMTFLDKRDADKPFFLYVGYYATHSPWSGHPDELVPDDEPEPQAESPPDGYRLLHNELADPTPARGREARSQYRAAVAEIDRGVGQILAALPDNEDTIIVYTADHGLSLGQNGIYGKGNATYPQNLFDENIRIPMILSRTGVWPEGKREPKLSDLTDLYTTLRIAADLRSPETDGMVRPGIDIVDPSASKAIQVCEYGPMALIIDNNDAIEVRQPDERSGPVAAENLKQFYRELGTQPPWEWVPPSEFVYNPNEAWHNRA